MTKLLKPLTRINPVILSLILLTFFTALAYLPLVPFLGFYSDDFFFGYIAHFYGVSGMIQSLVVDRPFNGYLLILLDSLLKDNVLLWHIFMFFVRLLGGYSLFFLLKKLWPDKLSIVTSMTVLFLIYPGFLQQTLPLGFGGWIINLTLATLSLTFTVFAIKESKKFKVFLFTLLAIIFQINVLLQLEFFIGIEVLRFLLIYYILTNNIHISPKEIKKVLRSWKYWSPYVAGLVLFLLWRILIFKGARQETDINWVMQTYYSNPLWIAKIPLEILYSAISTIILPYSLPIIIRIPRIPLLDSIIALSLGIIFASSLYFYWRSQELVHYKITDRGKPTKIFGKQLLIIGLVSIVGTLIPIIISGRYVRLFYVFDRYTISSIIAVTFVLMGFLLYKIPSSLQKFILISLVVLSITTHLMNGFMFALNWDKQKDIWWQLYWRSPKIKDNTMLIFDFPQNSNESLFKDIINKLKWYRIYWVDYQIWAPGNFFFNYDKSPQNHFRGEFLEDNNILQKIKDKTTEVITDRNITYTKDFGNTVIISTPNDQSCLWAIDSSREEFPSHTSDILKDNIVYSKIDNLVENNAKATPPFAIFGTEPQHNWCYYFQKASLARQFRQWNILSQLTEEVISQSLQPKDPNEWLPFIEGLIISKKYSHAEDLIKVTPTSTICKMLERLQTVELKKIYCQ